MESTIGTPCVLLTEKIVLDRIYSITNSSEKREVQKEAELYVCQHLLDLLHDGHLLTIDTNDQIRLWEGGVT